MTEQLPTEEQPIPAAVDPGGEPIDDRIPLTRREYSLVECLSRSLRNRAIGKELGITEGTVKVYLSRLAERLNISLDENLRMKMGADFLAGRFRKVVARERRVTCRLRGGLPLDLFVSERNRAVAAAYRDGISAPRIAMMADLSEQRIYAILKAAGVAMRTRHRPTSPDPLPSDPASGATAIAPPISTAGPGHRSAAPTSDGIGSRRCKCGECHLCKENARWERIFKEKFADPDYYDGLVVRMRSPLAGVS